MACFDILPSWDGLPTYLLRPPPFWLILEFVIGILISELTLFYLFFYLFIQWLKSKCSKLISRKRKKENKCLLPDLG